jgi:hypothetical protein
MQCVSARRLDLSFVTAQSTGCVIYSDTYSNYQLKYVFRELKNIYCQNGIYLMLLLNTIEHYLFNDQLHTLICHHITNFSTGHSILSSTVEAERIRQQQRQLI